MFLIKIMKYIMVFPFFITGKIAFSEEIQGKIYFLEGHVTPSCRVLAIKKDNGAIAMLRIPDTGADNSILAVAMMAYSQDRKVTAVYQDGVTTGCGTEPRIDFLRIIRPE